MLYFYTAGSGYSPDHITSWNTPQRITWTSTKAGQTSYPFNSPPEEDIEVEEVPAVSHQTFRRIQVDQTFRRIQTMRSTLDQEFNRSDRRVTEFHRELVLMFHHLILVIIDGTEE